MPEKELGHGVHQCNSLLLGLLYSLPLSLLHSLPLGRIHTLLLGLLCSLLPGLFRSLLHRLKKENQTVSPLPYNCLAGNYS
jgi:hypothetical protein